MKKIVVYYSLSGNTKEAAEKIAQKCDADVLELVKVKNKPASKFMQYFTAGRETILNILPKLEPYEFTGDKYEMIIFGTPIWANKRATPLNTFIAQNNLENKKIAVFTTSGSGNDKKCIEAFKKEFSNFVGSCTLFDKKNPKSSMNEERINEFVNKINKNDIV